MKSSKFTNCVDIKVDTRRFKVNRFNYRENLIRRFLRWLEG
jgi:hypothetical protein